MLSGYHRITWRRNIAENFNRLSRVHERYRRQTDRQADGRRQIANMNMSSRSLKTWQLRMHCNMRPPESRQSFPALIRPTTQCQVGSRWTYPLPYYSVFAADTLLYAVTMTSDFWPWTIVWDVMKLCNKIWTQSSNTQRIYCKLNIWPNDIERRVTCSARLWSNFHQVWPSTIYPCLNYSVFMLIRYVTLRSWPIDLERSV